MMLSELHETIQILFDWSGMYLHCFEARKTNGMNLTTRDISIRINEDEFFDLVEYDFEEEKLSEWLIMEEDKLVYVYDFGNGWRLGITLKKILQQEEGRVYL